MGRIYEDIALEYWSNYGKRVPEWVCKPLMCDYILYLILPLRKAYLLPVIQLQQAWRKSREYWLAKGRIIKAKNDGYTSHSVGVNAEVLYPAIGGCLRSH